MINEVIAWLQAQGYGTPGADLFLEGFEDLPLNAVAVFSVRGKEPDHSIGSAPIDYPEFQIQVRGGPLGDDKDAAYALAEEILDALDGTDIGAWTCWASWSPPVNVENERTDCVRYAVNYHCLGER
jgi:hypothetical protein